MPTDDDIDEIKERQICFNCVGENFLKDQIAKQGSHGSCSYCDGKAECYSIGKLSDLIETAFEHHYCRTSNEPTSFQYAMLKDKESNNDWERDGKPVVDAIMNAADIREKAASDIQKILEDKFSDFDSDAAGEETEFSSDSHYERRPTNDSQWQSAWRDFKNSLKTETRFFSRSASRLLVSVFDGIDKMQAQDGRLMIVDAGPGKTLQAVYRARCFQWNEKLEAALAQPDKHLGSPPSAHAHAGRMSAHGISVFYGANDPMVALAEIRPPVGSTVVVARFDIIRPIRLLDLTALNHISPSGSIFDPTFIELLERTMFLRTLSGRITAPVMPEHEMFEYLPTQAIADFLASESDPTLDGILYPSVQVAGDGRNIVLFHKSARVAAIELPEGTEVSASLGEWGDEGHWEDDYSVIEKTPFKERETKKWESPLRKNLADLPYTELAEIDYHRVDRDARSPTLRIDLESLRVHDVSAVQFRTSEFPVHRYRTETTKPKF